MITDRLMSVGEWGLELVPNAPESARAAFDFGHNIFVTPTRFDRSVSFATLKTASVYAGLVFRIGGGRKRFGGPGLLGYLTTGKGDSNSTASIGYPASFGPVAFGAVLAQFETDSILNGLTAGTGHSATATTASLVTGTFGPPVKSVLDTVALSTGNEYRVLVNGEIDYGVSTSLFRSTPTVAVSPGLKGADASLRVLESTAWDVERNIDNYRNCCFVETEDGSYASGVRDSAHVMFGEYGGTVLGVTYLSPTVTAETNVHAEVDAMATAGAAAYSSAAMEIDCSVREYCIPRFVTPGDWIWVYSVDDGLTDTANQVVFNGQTLFPKKVRCVGYTYPIEAGMGVYTYDTTGGTVTDVSDYVQWETGKDTTLELDSKPQSILDAGTRSVLL